MGTRNIGQFDTPFQGIFIKSSYYILGKLIDIDVGYLKLGFACFYLVRCERLNLWTVDQLRRLKPLSAGTVEENLVSVRFPDGRELGGTRPMQTEVDSARFVAPPQDSLCHRKRAGLKFILIANRRVDVVPKIFHAVDLLKTSQHF